MKRDFYTTWRGWVGLVSDVTVKLMTHTTRIRGVFDVTISLRYRPQFAAMIFQWSHAHCQHFSLWICGHCDLIALLPFSLCDFLCNFVLQLVETAVCSTILLIQYVFHILIYSFNWYCELAHLTRIKIIIVIMVLLNGKIIVHKIEFKIRAIIYRPQRYQPGTVAFIFEFTGQVSIGWPEMSNEKHLIFIQKGGQMYDFCQLPDLANCQCYQCRFSHFIVSKSGHSL